MHDWHTCDGSGRLEGNGVAAGVTRRGVMVGMGMGLLAWATPAIAQLAIDPAKRDGNVLVVVFLRGGADGLSLVVPFGDETYYRLRPNLAIQRRLTHPLDGFYGLHPSLAPLLPLYESGRMAVVHACGSQDETRSHFEAMDTMERGAAKKEGPSSGWIARYLQASEQRSDSPLRAVAFGSTMPGSLIGATGSVALESLTDYRLDIDPRSLKLLERLYAPGKDEIAEAGRRTFDVLSAMDRLNVSGYRPESGAAYPESDLGKGLRQTAQLIKAGIGLEIACLDKGGWDTHVAQGTATAGWLPTLLDDMARSLSAFDTDLGGRMDGVTVVVMSEFGRRIAENSGLGTDHGHGGVMFVLGGGVRGGRVHARWEGLEKAVGPGDLPVTTDYRDVLADVARHRLRPAATREVFAGYSPGSLGLMG
ncbi:MAG TPA: DUF1501 domain-containing protein [Fimbriimonas sp.]